jgi:hypothetical protein
MRLRYIGTGTVGIEGAGEVSHGETIEVSEAMGQTLLAEQPQHFIEEVAEAQEASEKE